MPVKVKICGITNTKDAQAAADAGADFLGFILYPKSSRYVQPGRVREILHSLKSTHVKTVGVFVDLDPGNISSIMEECGLDFAQLQGKESPDLVSRKEIAGQKNPLFGRCYKAIKIMETQEAFEIAARYAVPGGIRQEMHLPSFLIDSYHPDLPGGTGQTGNWEAASILASQYTVMLAGGLNIHNLQQAIQQVSPWGVDVASGTEASPGIKDHKIVERFIQIAKENSI